MRGQIDSTSAGRGEDCHGINFTNSFERMFFLVHRVIGQIPMQV